MSSPSPSFQPGLGIVAQQRRLADHSADRRMVMLAAMAVVVGTGGAFSGWLLIHLIDLVINLAWFGRLSFDAASIASSRLGLAAMAIPIVGGVLIGLMARFGSDKIRGHGIPEAIEAILFGDSLLSPKVALLKPISAAISIGTGGPFGAEGPIIMTGGAIGSLFAQRFHMSSAERRTLLVAGAAAGMTTIFGTPLAAIMLALEVLLFEWKPRSFVPVVASVLTTLLWRPLLIGSGSLFTMTALAPQPVEEILVSILLGLVVGLAGAALSSGLYWIEDMFHRLPVHWMWWPAIGAVAVGLGGLIEPHALGAGYDNLEHLLDGSLLFDAVLLLLAVKAFIWLVALGSNTSGGVLAPLLTLGGAIGAVAGHWLGVSGFWALIGMAAMMAAAMRAPLTGAIFAAELVGRLDVLPGTAASAVAGYGLAVLMLRRSILTEKIARRGRHLSYEYGIDPLALVPIGEIMTAAPESLEAGMTLDEVVAFFVGGALHRSYPVVDGQGRPIGVVARVDALRWSADPDLAGMTLGKLVSDASLLVLTPDMHTQQAADLMITEETTQLPVVDRASGRLIGIVAHRDLLRARSKHNRGEQVRQRFTGTPDLAPALDEPD